mgnify:CR=1 FL=1
MTPLNFIFLSKLYLPPKKKKHIALQKNEGLFYFNLYEYENLVVQLLMTIS